MATDPMMRQELKAINITEGELPPLGTASTYKILKDKICAQTFRCPPTFMSLGNLNAWLDKPRDKLKEDLARALSDQGLVNVTDHFLPRQ